MAKGQLTVWVEEDVRRRLKVQAAYYGRSMAEIVGEALQEWLTAVELHPVKEEQG